MPAAGPANSVSTFLATVCVSIIFLSCCCFVFFWQMNGKASDEENLNKSEISQVFEIALKRNLPVNFEVRPWLLWRGMAVRCGVLSCLGPVCGISSPGHVLLYNNVCTGPKQ